MLEIDKRSDTPVYIQIYEELKRQIITGEKPVEAFDDFVKQWNDMGGAKITEEANEWYHSR